MDFSPSFDSFGFGKLCNFLICSLIWLKVRTYVLQKQSSIKMEIESSRTGITHYDLYLKNFNIPFECRIFDYRQSNQIPHPHGYSVQCDELPIFKMFRTLLNDILKFNHSGQWSLVNGNGFDSNGWQIHISNFRFGRLIEFSVKMATQSIRSPVSLYQTWSR